jgi:hypothetical protein
MSQEKRVKQLIFSIGERAEEGEEEKRRGT